MEQHRFEIAVEAGNRSEASAGARSLADQLREAPGVFAVERTKDDPTSQELGAIVQIIASSGATIAIAQGIAAWLRARRAVSLQIRRDGRSGSIEAIVQRLDPQAAIRIVELVSKS